MGAVTAFQTEGSRWQPPLPRSRAAWSPFVEWSIQTRPQQMTSGGSSGLERRFLRSWVWWVTLKVSEIAHLDAERVWWLRPLTSVMRVWDVLRLVPWKGMSGTGIQGQRRHVQNCRGHPKVEWVVSERETVGIFILIHAFQKRTRSPWQEPHAASRASMDCLLSLSPAPLS